MGNARSRMFQSHLNVNSYILSKLLLLRYTETSHRTFTCIIHVKDNLGFIKCIISNIINAENDIYDFIVGIYARTDKLLIKKPVCKSRLLSST